MARVKWFQEHSAKQKYSSPVEIWYSGLFKPFGPATFMPVERIKEICIACDISINGEEVIAVNPMQKGVLVNKPYKSLLASYLVILS